MIDERSNERYTGAVLLSRFQYDLPPERVALYPTERRVDARLMLLDRASGQTDTSQHISHLEERVQPGDVWVINDTRVRPARVLCHKATGGRVELLVLSARGAHAEAIYRSSKPLREGAELHPDAGGPPLVVARNLGEGRVALTLPGEVEVLLERVGQIPLPPYIDRAPEASDAQRYQTVYADQPGAVAAPTAGLHFTEALMRRMEARGARFARVTLHVGPGTFRPIRSEDVANHTLHEEHYRVGSEAAELINGAKRVVAVGTTSVRTLEHAGRDGTVQPGEGATGLYIMPGYRFRIIDALLTNFHLPGSSLIVLVSALCGVEPVMAAYQRALAESFRFYSYGDAMFIS